jgi:hypothetical protein
MVYEKKNSQAIWTNFEILTKDFPVNENYFPFDHYFTVKQTLANLKIFSEKYFTANQTEPKSYFIKCQPKRVSKRFMKLEILNMGISLTFKYKCVVILRFCFKLLKKKKSFILKKLTSRIGSLNITCS